MDKKPDGKEVAWQLFQKTGKINYYLLYAQLRGEEKWKK